MALPTAKRRKEVNQRRDNPAKRVRKIKKQPAYHSSSEEESADDEQHFQPMDLNDSDNEDTRKASRSKKPTPNFKNKLEEDEALTSGHNTSDEGENSDSDSLSETSTNALSRKRKRNDPEAFATSISKILSSKLTTSKRADPVLARSKDAAAASKEFSEAKLEAKAKHKLKEEKRAGLERGRVKDVLGSETADTSTQEIIELEKRLKKTAQRGVIKMFNAVRAAQVKGEEAAKEAKITGLVGIGKREDKVTEMTKKSFLDFIAGSGKKPQLAANA